MKQKISWVAVLLVVFFIGFLSGSLWQTLQQNLRSIPVELSVTLKPEETEKNKGVEISSPDNKLQKTMMEEEKMSRALSDPDFKRVHDFLIRDKPIQMNLDQIDF
jgi:cytoskeletal protein RodZ